MKKSFSRRTHNVSMWSYLRKILKSLRKLLRTAKRLNRCAYSHTFFQLLEKNREETGFIFQKNKTRKNRFQWIRKKQVSEKSNCKNKENRKQEKTGFRTSQNLEFFHDSFCFIWQRPQVYSFFCKANLRLEFWII